MINPELLAEELQLALGYEPKYRIQMENGIIRHLEAWNETIALDPGDLMIMHNTIMAHDHTQLSARQAIEQTGEDEKTAAIVRLRLSADQEIIDLLKVLGYS